MAPLPVTASMSPAIGAIAAHARLPATDVASAAASDDMKAIMVQLQQEAPQRNTNWSVTLVPIHEQTVDQIRPALYVLAGAVLVSGFVALTLSPMLTERYLGAAAKIRHKGQKVSANACTR